MRHPFVPLLLLALVPAGYLAARLGLLRHRATRAALAAALLLIGVYAATRGGVLPPEIAKLKLGLAAAVALVLLLRRLRCAPLRRRRSYLQTLCGLAALGWLVYLDFFSFHGARFWMHPHDVAHYYLGSRYFPELGYTGLYTAMLRAEAELYAGRVSVEAARDLGSGALVSAATLLERSDEVRGRFSPERWKAFLRDAHAMRRWLGSTYATALADHGFNATPFWALIGGAVANRVPAGSQSGIWWLTLFDALLVPALFAAVAWAFGAEAALLAMLYFCLLFGAEFLYTGGAFLRYLWLSGLLLGVSCLRRGWSATAGALLAFSALLRVFPAAFAAGLLAKAAWDWIEQRRVDRTHRRFLLAFAATAALLFAASLHLPGGLGNWADFLRNAERQRHNVTYNNIGLTEVFAYRPPGSASFDEQLARQRQVSRVLLLTALPAALIFLVLRSRRVGSVRAMALGTLPVFAALKLGSYYAPLLLINLLAERRRTGRLAVLFAGEALVYTLGLFEDRPETLFFYRNVVLGLVLADLYLDGLREELGRPFRRAPATGTAAPRE